MVNHGLKDTRFRSCRTRGGWMCMTDLGLKDTRFRRYLQIQIFAGQEVVK